MARVPMLTKQQLCDYILGKAGGERNFDIIDARDIADHFGVPPNRASAGLWWLAQIGLLKRIGSVPRGKGNGAGRARTVYEVL